MIRQESFIVLDESLALVIGKRFIPVHSFKIEKCRPSRSLYYQPSTEDGLYGGIEAPRCYLQVNSQNQTPSVGSFLPVYSTLGQMWLERTPWRWEDPQECLQSSSQTQDQSCAFL
jgi:hypothetical protein